MPRTARLLFGNTDRVPDLTYATSLFVPDDFAWFQTQAGKTRVLLGPLEIDRARRTARVDACLDLEEEKKRLGLARAPYPGILAAILRNHGIRSAEIPSSFPVGLFRELQKAGIRLKPVSEPFFPGRLRKTGAEIRHIGRALRAAEAGLQRAVEVLRASRIGPGQILRWDGSILTSERLRIEMESTCLRAGAIAKDTIVAGGMQACDPHERGSGPLRAHQAIILDIFPRDPHTGYFGDITRTVVKGSPAEALNHLHTTVVQGQKRILRQIRPGLNGQKAQEDLRDWFRCRGYPTEIRRGRWTGFFHGVGHGLGLEIHEAPRFAIPRLPAGCVLTVEPGLYIPGLGGVRIEDVVHLGGHRWRRLTRFPDVWRIR
ncbi:MAG: aminopeptidase P family protein [Verrucomicrobia bacterium]|nr:aminopeptidase P family protein [Verrucomicrobiota bacterium]